MGDVIDLDALMPQAVVVKISGQEITIQPPKTADILRLGYLGQKLENADNLNQQELDQLIADLTQQIYRCAPDLSGIELSTSQLLTLVGILSDMSTPPERQELDKRGIAPAGPKE